jgi:NAD(P)-dependent dehydrogenase (short-subunit alcohol dehydrogenase family)
VNTELVGRTGLVTGAGSGIGRASAVALARRGAHVVVCDLGSQRDGAEETLRLIGEAGGSATFVAADVTDDTSWPPVIAAVLEVSGRLDFAHNNAGVGLASGFLDTTLADYRRTLEVNLTGVWLGLRHQIAVMREQGGGAIVNTASLAGLKGLPRGAAYAASKHAVVGLTRSVAVEFADEGIRVNCVCPAAVSTAMTAALPDELRDEIVARQPIKRFARPDEVGEAVAWLCSDSSSFVTGIALPVDAGATAG